MSLIWVFIYKIDNGVEKERDIRKESFIENLHDIKDEYKGRCYQQDGTRSQCANVKLQDRMDSELQD